MRPKSITLISPNGSPIIGLLTKSGGTCAVTCKFSRREGENYFFFEVPTGLMDEVVSVDGDQICVDQNGKHWPSMEVIRTSTQHAT